MELGVDFMWSGFIWLRIGFNVMFSANTVTMITSRRIKWTGHVARIVEIRNAYKILV
jgi:hypothetical protein